MTVRSFLPLLPYAGLLFILPFPGTVALRLLCLAVAFVYTIYAWKRLAVPPFPLKPALAVWVLVALASLFYAVDPADSLSEIKNELTYTMMAFVAFFVITCDERRMKWMFLALVAGAFVLCIWALAARMSLGYWEDSGRYGGRVSFATYLVAVAPVVVLMGFYFEDLRLRRLSLVLLGLLLVTGFFSLQRIIWIVLLVQAGLAWFLLWRFKLIHVRFRFIAAVFFGGTILAAGMLIAVQLTRTHEFSTLSTDVRGGFWPAVAGRILETPLTGAGFGRGALSKKHRDLTPPDAPYLWHAHNVFLNYGLAMGVPGILALTLLFAGLIRAYWRFCRGRDPHLRMLGIAGIMLVGGVVLRNQVNDMFLRDQAILFWALNGVLLGLGQRKLLSERASA